MKCKVGILWLRNDLRIRDNEALCRAIDSAQEILPVYCLDPRQYKDTSNGFAKTGPFRENFLCESLLELQQNLRKRGSDLLCMRGKPEEVLPRLAMEVGATSVFAHKEAASEERAVERAVENQLFKNGIGLEMYWGSTLYHPDDLPMPIVAIPEVFTQFRKQIEKYTDIREEWLAPSQIPTAPMPSSEPIPQAQPVIIEGSAFPFEGGETAANQRLEEYLWEKDLLRTYKETRNGLLGTDYSSKLSPWLALGCISPRTIYQEIKRYEKKRIKNASTYWLVFELIWRDYFHYIARKHGKFLFMSGGIKRAEEREWNRSEQHLQAWINGRTGIPFIDANMRELAATGFMSNRGRQNVASFLVHDLNIDWRLGAEYFESVLVDYDVSSNWGNWTYIAGVGNDPRENRYFNILSQARRYDPRGDYIRQWIPELADLPNSLIHDPGNAPASELAIYGVILGSTYPNPIVEFRGGKVPVL